MKNKLISSALGVAIVMSGVGFTAQAADYNKPGMTDKVKEILEKHKGNPEALNDAKNELKAAIEKKFQDFEKKAGVSEDLRKLTLVEIEEKTKPFKKAQEDILTKSKELQKETERLKKEGKKDSPELQKIQAELDILIQKDKDNSKTYGPLFVAENIKKQKKAYLDYLDKLDTLEKVEKFKASIEASATIDEHSDAAKLAKAKAEAKEFLKKHGVTGEQYFYKIDSAKDLKEVENWKNEIFKIFGKEDAVMAEFEKLLEDIYKDYGASNYYVYMKFKADLEKAADLAQKQQTLKEIKFFLKVAMQEAAENNIPFKDYLDALGEIWSKTPATPETPSVVEGWVQDSTGWWYRNADATYPANEWKLINGTWYHFDEKGYMQTGWINLDGTWYYLNADGSMAHDTWIGSYYVNASGAWVVEGWQQNGYGWWYQRANGTYPANGWEMINGVWYYFDANGYMLADTTTPDGYMVDANGAWVK